MYSVRPPANRAGGAASLRFWYFFTRELGSAGAGAGCNTGNTVFAFLSAAPRVLFVRGQAGGASGGGAAGAVPAAPNPPPFPLSHPGGSSPPTTSFCAFILLLEPTLLRNLMVIPCLQFIPSDGHLKQTLSFLISS